jgi:hypothetical protein
MLMDDYATPNRKHLPACKYLFLKFFRAARPVLPSSLSPILASAIQRRWVFQFRLDYLMDLDTLGQGS